MMFVASKVITPVCVFVPAVYSASIVKVFTILKYQEPDAVAIMLYELCVVPLYVV